MLNVHELERTWLRYKIKYLLPRIIAAALAISATVGALLYWTGTSQKPETASQSPNKQQAVVSEVIVTQVKKSIPVTKAVPEPATPQPTTTSTHMPTERTVTILKPSMDFMQDIEDESRSYHAREPIKKPAIKPYKKPEPVSAPQAPVAAEKKTVVSVPVKVETIPEEKQVVSVPVKVGPTPEKNTVVPAPKRSTIKIVAKQNEKDLQDVIRRFKKNKNPALSLFIAKSYYETGRYQESYNYALITNDIDYEIEDSWLIFAKSLVHLDQKEMAIKALSSYINNSDSARAKMLLDEIKKGAFR